jgi:ABC-type transport system involved in cytochrome bd biosynthesis fused ATPase/permease subunit
MACRLNFGKCLLTLPASTTPLQSSSDVTFEYPGSKSKVKPLRNISFTVKAGQLVVVVGANGSGKSTIIKLLSRLYDCTSGEILVDGRNIKDYKIADLRRATAMLTQEHTIYPLSIFENIGLGFPNYATDDNMVIEAAKQGGAHEFILKQEKEFQTVLCARDRPYKRNVRANDTLLAEVEKLPKPVEVSGTYQSSHSGWSQAQSRFIGGEKQRLVA